MSHFRKSLQLYHKKERDIKNKTPYKILTNNILT